MRRGLTMVEMLAALVLVGAVAGVAAAWLREAASTTAAVTPLLRWRGPAEAVLQLVQDDLINGDRSERAGPPRVEVRDGALRVRTRGRDGDFAGSVLHEYHCSAHRVELRERTQSGKERARLLLDQVKRWECELDEETGTLRVTLESESGDVVSRRYVHAR